MLPIDPVQIVTISSGVVLLAVLFAVLKTRGLRDSTARLMAGLVVFLLGWLAVETLSRMQEVRFIGGFDRYALARIGTYCLLVSAVLFFQLTRKFLQTGAPAPANADSLRNAGWAAGVLFLAAGVLLYENPIRLPDALFARNGYYLPRWNLAFDVLVVSWGLFWAAAVVLTRRAYHVTIAPLHRNRNKYWSIAIMLAVAGQIPALAVQGLGPLRVPAAVLQALAAATAAFVLLTYKLPDLRQVSRRAATFLIITLLTVAVYTGGFFAANAVFRSMPGYNPLVVGSILAVIMALLFNPLLGLVSRVVNHLISGTGYDPRHTVAEYSQNVANILEIERLATVALGLIGQVMENSSGALIIIHHQPGLNPGESAGGTYLLRSISGVGQELPEGKLTTGNPAMAALRREHHPLSQYDIDLNPRYSEMKPSERAWWSSLAMDVYVPIYAKEYLIGLLAIGPKRSGDRYFDEDLVLLQTLADQTAVALENARLFDDLKQRNAENERLNDELKSANEALARLDRAKSDFISIASHELRTPLTQVLGFNDILNEMVHSGSIEKSVATQMTEGVRRAARRLEEIVDTMFDVSKLDTNTLDLAYGPVGLASVVTSAISNWSIGLETRKLTITVRGLAGLPPVNGDSRRLTQVFSHLVQNAIKSTPDGGQITISGREVEPDPSLAQNGSRYVEVRVSDSGIGIAPEDLERIFEKFYRVGNVLLHSSGDTKFKGAGPGLGLTIARGIVEAHGGRIWAESQGHDEENCPGASFHVLLPVNAKRPEMPV